MKFWEWIKKTLFTKHRKTVVDIELGGADEFERKVGELTERMAKLAELCGTVREEAERAADTIARLNLVVEGAESQDAALIDHLKHINTPRKDNTDRGL